MPLYTYKCSVCGHGRDIFKPIADIDRTEECFNCKFPMNRQVSAPMVLGDYAGYECPVTGKWVEGRRAHEENLKRTGCRLLEPGETQEVLSDRRRSEQQFDKHVEETAERAFEALPTRKKEALSAEIQAGVDTQLVRSTRTAT